MTQRDGTVYRTDKHANVINDCQYLDVGLPSATHNIHVTVTDVGEGMRKIQTLITICTAAVCRCEMLGAWYEGRGPQDTPALYTLYTYRERQREIDIGDMCLEGGVTCIKMIYRLDTPHVVLI